MSLDAMKSSMKVFSSSQAFTDLLQNVNNPFLLLFIGVGLTALLQSSSALTTILIVMVTAGLMIGKGPNDIIYVILGTNIGSCVTALLSSFGASINGKRASLIHLMFNTFGSLIFFILSGFSLGRLCFSGFIHFFLSCPFYWHIIVHRKLLFFLFLQYQL